MVSADVSVRIVKHSYASLLHKPSRTSGLGCQVLLEVTSQLGLAEVSVCCSPAAGSKAGSTIALEAGI